LFVRRLAASLLVAVLLWQGGGAAFGAARTCVAAVRGDALAPRGKFDADHIGRVEAESAAALLRAHCKPGDDVVVEPAPTAAGVSAAEKVRIIAYPIRVFDLRGYLHAQLTRARRVFHLALHVGGQETAPNPLLVLRPVAANEHATLSVVVSGARRE
jgi:mRNA-degrading endonuclease toxin of MazEF toxin-antitoxin module